VTRLPLKGASRLLWFGLGALLVLIPLAAAQAAGDKPGRLAGQAKPEDILFVFARAEEGPRMPLAATRATVADLPLHFRFDDSMALGGGRKLSDFKTVGVEARIAKAGMVQSSRGDLRTLKGVQPGTQNLRLPIDNMQP